LPPKIIWLTNDSIVNFRITHTKCAKDIPAFMQVCGYFVLIAVSILLISIYGMQKMLFWGHPDRINPTKGANYGIESRFDTPN
jgi:hypothetical protein